MLPSPVFPLEVVALILGHLTPAEACLPCLVAKAWGDLGQSIIWSRIDYLPVNDVELDCPGQPLAILFGGGEPRLRLGRKIKMLKFQGGDLSNEPAAAEEVQREEVPSGVRVGVFDTCRKLLESCTLLDDLWLEDFHPSMLRMILETASTSAADSLTEFTWTHAALGSEELPADSTNLSTTEILDFLHLFPKLSKLHLQLPLRSAPDPHPLQPSDSGAPSISPLSLSKLVIADSYIISSGVTQPLRGTDGGSTAAIIRSANKETLRTLFLYSDGLFAPFAQWLSQPGFKLTHLMLRIIADDFATFVEALISTLLFHQHLASLTILPRMEHHLFSIPRTFFKALPRGLVHLAVAVDVDLEDEALKEFMRGPVGSKLEEFRTGTKSKIGEAEEGLAPLYYDVVSGEVGGELFVAAAS